MKIPYYFGIAVMLLIANASYSYSSYHDTNLVEQIKPNLMARSKPTYTKYAAVSFLKSGDTAVEFGGKLDVKSQCGALGYIIKVDTCTSKTGKLNGATGKYFKPSKLCSDDSAMSGLTGADKTEAEKYTTGCCDSRVYTITEDKECPYNAAKITSDSCYYKYNDKYQNMYRCACDRGRYQYSTIKGEQCGAAFNSFNANLACVAYEPRTEKNEMYFISCCPGSYKVCDSLNHEVGRGNECRVTDSKENLLAVAMNPSLLNKYIYSKFEECPCAAHYDTECPSDRVINRNLICEDSDHKIWTMESNCESSCSKTIETNIDSYLYKSSWHCLYRKDGAIVRDDEDLFDPKNLNSKEGYCGIFDASSNVGTYDECVAQGFNKTTDDCHDGYPMLICPNDSTKVWCLDGRYCSGYNTGGTLKRKLSKNDAVNKNLSVCEPNENMVGYDRYKEGSNAAKVEFCATSDQGIRCRYKYDAPIGKEDCNKCWNDGLYMSGADGCLVSDANNIREVGMGSKCCNDGYYMYQGVCQKNECDRTKYPYDIRPPYDAGEIEECREGDPTTTLGYRAYFGYKSCNIDQSAGEMWTYDPTNNRRCICARNGEDGRDYVLPFTLDEYYISNGDDTAPGFSASFYGTGISCTDADGSYYGYTMCYLGRMTKNGDGKCYRNTKRSDASTTYPYGDDGAGRTAFKSPNAFLYWNNLGLLSPAIIYDPRKTEDSYCVNKYTHCQAKDGTPLGDSDVCALVPEGCNLGYEAACGECYHPISVKKGDDGLYHLNDTVQIKVHTYNNTDMSYAITKCPPGTKKAGSSNACYKYCYHHDMSKCAPGDILAYCPTNDCVSGSEFATGALKVGLVVDREANRLYAKHLKPTSDKSTYTWSDALVAAANYAPAGCDAICQYTFGKGKWELSSTMNGYTPYSLAYFRGQPENPPRSVSAGPYYHILRAEGYDYVSTAFWTSVKISDTTAYRATRGDVCRVFPQTDEYAGEYFIRLSIPN